MTVKTTYLEMFWRGAFNPEVFDSTAATRARDQLIVTSWGVPSPFLALTDR